VFSDDPACRSALFDGDRLKEVGETVIFDDLADSLREIGAEGSRTFYRGELADRMVADLSERGSSLTSADLSSYRAVERPPLSVEVGGWEASSNPSPAIGGIMMLSTVRRIAQHSEPLNPETWALILADTLVHRREYERSGDLDHAIEDLMLATGLKSPSTISVAAVDNSGTAVAATFSSGYGSGVIPRDTGLLMNNSLGEIELVPGGVDAQVSGQRMMSNMAPTTCRSANSVVAIGSPGADRITSALALTLVRLLVAGDDFEAAIEHPRLHPENLEPLQLAAEVGLDLQGDIRWYRQPHMFFGGVNGAGLIDGSLVAHADSRRVGSAVVV
jgi:gamma-glutamyltranspeptidase/glutathione hydrolase